MQSKGILRAAGSLLALSVLLSGCATPSSPQNSGTPPASGSAQPSVQPSASQTSAAPSTDPVAKVYDEAITRAELETVFAEQRAVIQGNYGIDIGADEASKQSYMQNFLDQLIEKKIRDHNVEKLGLQLTSEDEATVEAELQKALDEVKESIRTDVTQKATTDVSINVDTETEAEYQRFLQERVQTIEQFKTQQREQLLSTKLDDVICKDVKVLDADVQAEYDKQVTEAKARYKADPKAFANEATSMLSTDLLVIPAGYVQVKHILVGLRDSQKTIVSELRTSAGDAAADAKQAEFMDVLKAEADAVLSKAKATGADFDQLVKDYGSDPGVQGDTPSAQEGYFVAAGSGMEASFEQAALALTQDGQVSDLVPTPYGYHILKRIAATTETVKPFDAVKTNLSESLLIAKRETKIEEQSDAWKKEANVQILDESLKMDTSATN